MTSLLDAYSQRQNQQSQPKGFREKTPRGYSTATLQQFTPEQLDLLSQMIDQLGPDSFLAKLAGGDEDFFSQIEAPALKQFNALQGNLASRFSGMGGQGALSSRKSSGFQNTANQAASDFAQQLQSNRLGLQNEAIGSMQGYANALLGQRPYERSLAEKGKSNFEKGLDYTLQGLNTASKFIP